MTFKFPNIDPTNMTARTYTIATRLTAIYPKEQAMAYLALGLCSEVTELQDALARDAELTSADSPRTDIAKEAGDVLWYSFRLLDEIFLTYEYPDDWGDYAPSGYHGAFAEIGTAAGNIAGFVKKAIRDTDGVIVTDEQADKIKAEIIRVVKGITDLASGEGLDMRTIAAANIAKLLDRKDRGVIGGSGDNR